MLKQHKYLTRPDHQRHRDEIPPLIFQRYQVWWQYPELQQYLPVLPEMWNLFKIPDTPIAPDMKCEIWLRSLILQLYRSWKQCPQPSLTWEICLIWKDGRGGRLIQPIRQEIACHFSQDHTMIAKFLDFINKHPIYIDGSSRLIGNHDFLGSKIKKIDFFNFLKKNSNFISNLNVDCSQLSFEVYNACVALKLQILEIFDLIFLPWPWPLRRLPESLISTSVTLIGYQTLAKGLSFYVRYCLLLLNEIRRSYTTFFQNGLNHIPPPLHI